MPTRFRRSIKIAPGVKLNVGKKGVSSVSFGGKYIRQTVGSGRKRTSVSIPGTGLGLYQSGSTRSSAKQRPVPAPAPAKPGLFAPAAEKRFYEGMVAYRREDWAAALAAFRAANTANPASPSPSLFGALCCVALGDNATALSLLERVVENAHLPDTMMLKYAPGIIMQIGVTERIIVNAPLDSVGPALALAELYQTAGRREDAIGLMQQLHEADRGDSAVALSLADLLYEDGDDEAVVELAAGVANDSGVTLGLLHLKAKSLLRQGLGPAAVTELTACLKKTRGRDAELLKEIRYDRALAYENLGQQAKARADFEKLYAEDPGYRDVKERVLAKG